VFGLTILSQAAMFQQCMAGFRVQTDTLNCLRLNFLSQVVMHPSSSPKMAWPRPLQTLRTCGPRFRIWGCDGWWRWVLMRVGEGVVEREEEGEGGREA
jgi:hypothetical protein